MRLVLALAIIYVALYIATMLFSGCKTTSTVMHTTATVTDSTVHAAKVESHADDSTAHHTVVADSTIGLKATGVILNLTKTDLLPVFTATGIAMPRTFTADSGRAHAIAIVNTDGSVTIDCKTDSLTMVINRLIRDSVFQRSSFDSLRLMKIVATHTADTDTVSITKTVTTFWGRIWPYLLGLVFVGAVVLVWKFIKPKV